MFKKEGERATEKCCSCSFFFFSFFRDCRFISFSFFFLVLFCFSSKSKHLLTSQMCYPSHRKKIRDSHFRVFKEYPQKCQIWKSETSPKQGTWLGIPLLRLVSLCQIWDLYGFSLKYPKISNNGNLLFFSCVNGSMLQPSSHSENLGYLEIHTGVY